MGVEYTSAGAEDGGVGTAGGVAGALEAYRRCKGELARLEGERGGLEAEMAEIVARLTAEGQPGLPGGEALVDAEGFPRSDVDVYRVRHDRHRLACLRTDVRALTDAMEAKLVEVHGLMRELPKGFSLAEGGVGAPRAGTPAPGAGRGGAGGQGRAFGVIDEVSPSGPAEEDGLRVGDLVTDFAGIRLHAGVGGASGGETAEGLLPKVAETLARNEGKPIQVTVLRRGESTTLSLTPRPWPGRGLLGAHLRPLR